MPIFEFSVTGIGETWGHFGVRVPDQEMPEGCVGPARTERKLFEILLNDVLMPQWLRMSEDRTEYADLRLRKLGRDTMYSVKLRETHFGKAWGDWQAMATFSTQPHPPQVGELMECRDGYMSFNWGVCDPKKGAGVKLVGDQVPEEYMFNVQMRRVKPKESEAPERTPSGSMARKLSVAEIFDKHEKGETRPRGLSALGRAPSSSVLSKSMTGNREDRSPSMHVASSTDPPHPEVVWAGEWEEVGITEKPFIRLPLQGDISEYYFRVRLSKHFVGQKGRLIPTWGEQSTFFHWTKPPCPKPATHLRVADLGATHALLAWDLPKNYVTQPRLIFNVFVDASERDNPADWLLVHTTDTTSFAFDSLVPSRQYRIAVQSDSAYGKATRSNVLSFTTHAAAGSAALSKKHQGFFAAAASTVPNPASCKKRRHQSVANTPLQSLRPSTAPAADASPMLSADRHGTPSSRWPRQQGAPRTLASLNTSLPQTPLQHLAPMSPLLASPHFANEEKRSLSELRTRSRVVHGIPGVLPPPKPSNLYDKYRVDKERKAHVLENLGVVRKRELTTRGKQIMAILKRGMAFMDREEHPPPSRVSSAAALHSSLILPDPQDELAS